MSQWTHIRGGFELDSSAVEIDKSKIKNPKPKGPRTAENEKEFIAYWEDYKKSAYYPYPEEQFVLGTPTLQDTWEGKAYTRIQVYEYSLPRARKYIEEAFELLPQGEVGWHPSIKQDKYDCRASSSCSDFKCQQKAFEKGILNLYKDEFPYMKFKELNKLLKFEIRWLDHITGIIIGIRDDIRYCSGKEMQEGLEKFFMYLDEHDITVEDGYLEWQDEWDDDHIYAWRKSRLSNDDHEFLLLDKKTNKILHSKIYRAKYNEDYSEKEYEIIEEDFE